MHALHQAQELYRHTGVFEQEQQALQSAASADVQRASQQPQAAVAAAALRAIVTHLDQRCCWQTAQALQHALAAARPEVARQLSTGLAGVDGMRWRQQVMHLVCAGSSDEARCQLLRALCGTYQVSCDTQHCAMLDELVMLQILV